jgi:Cu+-exporting ATPase
MNMFQRVSMLSVLLIGLPSAMGEAKSHDRQTSDIKQKTCPVMGNAVKEDVHTTYKGKKVYFCCKACIPKFEKSPAKYLPDLYKQIYPQQVQVKCPVMGGTVNRELSVEHDGHKVYFCCKGCEPKFKAAPEKYLKKLPEVSTDQVHCPVMGRIINPKLSVEKDGQKIYFCCKGCIPKFKENSEKYIKYLPPTAGLLAHGPTLETDLLLCPVCGGQGTPIHPRSDLKMIEYKGMYYVVCGSNCAEKFKKNPDKYIKVLHDALVERAGGPAEAYTCPMHPQVVQEKTGRCPLCEMHLKKASELK